MSIVSHLHQFFDAETCRSYIHTLRWKDRPLQCPRCQSLNVGPWGTYHAPPLANRSWLFLTFGDGLLPLMISGPNVVRAHADEISCQPSIRVAVAGSTASGRRGPSPLFQPSNCAVR
jgi:hypothetical protein